MTPTWGKHAFSILTPQCCDGLSGILPTTESDSAVSCLWQSLTPRCPAYTTESDSASSCLPQSLTPYRPAYHRVWLRIVLPIIKSHYAVFRLPLSVTLRCRTVSWLTNYEIGFIDGKMRLKYGNILPNYNVRFWCTFSKFNFKLSSPSAHFCAP